MSDVGIKVSSEGFDVLSATDAQTLMNIHYPFMKIDTTNPVSFQNIVLTFNTDPPESSGISPDTSLVTTVYSFNHGYSYRPATWTQVFVVTPPPSGANSQTYFTETGYISRHTAADGAIFLTQFDDQKVYYKINKFLFTAGGGSANNIIGTVLRIRTYVFVQDINF